MPGSDQGRPGLPNPNQIERGDHHHGTTHDRRALGGPERQPLARRSPGQRAVLALLWQGQAVHRLWRRPAHRRVPRVPRVQRYRRGQAMTIATLTPAAPPALDLEARLALAGAVMDERLALAGLAVD